MALGARSGVAWVVSGKLGWSGAPTWARLLCAASVLFTARPLRAHTSHHHVGSGGGSDDDADCLRWEQVSAADAEASPDDATGGAANDAAAPGNFGPKGDAGGGGKGLTLVCAEHATLFGCDCRFGAGSPRSGKGEGGSLLVIMLVLGGARCLARSRRRRSRS